jgi:septum site-determining protein MinD
MRVAQALDTVGCTQTLKRERATNTGMLAVAGGKGGCGKTTTALGLARALSRQGAEPLVVDTDCDMPDIHHVAGIERAVGSGASDSGVAAPTDADSGVATLARGDALGRAVQYSSAFPGVGLVTAGKPGQVDAALRATAGWHGPVILDCPAGVGPDATRPLRHADATLAVSTDDPQCLDDTRRTITAARELAAPPVGVYLRTTLEPPDTAPASVGDCPVTATAPSVADPFADPELERTWTALADTIHSGDTSGARRHERECCRL